jgi:hypothetical protein
MWYGMFINSNYLLFFDNLKINLLLTSFWTDVRMILAPVSVNNKVILVFGGPPVRRRFLGLFFFEFWNSRLWYFWVISFLFLESGS